MFSKAYSKIPVSPRIRRHRATSIMVPTGTCMIATKFTTIHRHFWVEKRLRDVSVTFTHSKGQFIRRLRQQRGRQQGQSHKSRETRDARRKQETDLSSSEVITNRLDKEKIKKRIRCAYESRIALNSAGKAGRRSRTHAQSGTAHMHVDARDRLARWLSTEDSSFPVMVVACCVVFLCS